MTTAYPLSASDERTLPPDFSGWVYVWDIDKTYLATAFSSMRGLLRVPLEFAVDKRAIPGMPEVLRGLRRGPGPEFLCAPLYFVSASPPQLRSVVAHKMLLDGVEYDGITFKDWLGTLLQLSPYRLREQVGFKLAALLHGRRRRRHAREVLVGDDVERDVEAFDLYARLLSGEVGAGQAEDEMKRLRVRRADRKFVRAALDEIPSPRGTVERIYIHLERDTPPERFAPFGPRVRAVRGACQLALSLYAEGRVDAECVRAACRAVRASRHRHNDVPRLIEDALARGLIAREALAALELPNA